MIGGGRRHQPITLADGFPESSESWADLLRSHRWRGIRVLVLAVVDGALGFRKSLCEVFSDTAKQRCWFHTPPTSLPLCDDPTHRRGRLALCVGLGAL